MVELDFVSILLPVVLAGIVSLVIWVITTSSGKLGKTADGTLTGTIKLEHVSAGLDNMEEKIDKNAERLEKLIGKVDGENKTSFKELADKMEKLGSAVNLNTYRIDRLERNGNTGKGAV